jgi:hypothetical protein
MLTLEGIKNNFGVEEKFFLLKLIHQGKKIEIKEKVLIWCT